jgi:hypothetical protein
MQSQTGNYTADIVQRQLIGIAAGRSRLGPAFSSPHPGADRDGANDRHD